MVTILEEEYTNDRSWKRWLIKIYTRMNRENH